MPNSTSKRLVSAAFFLFVGCAGFLTFALGGPAVPATARTLDVQQLRVLAGTEGPVRLRTVEVSAGAQRGFLLRAGGDLGLHDLPVYPVEIELRDGTTLLLEPATDAACSEGFLPIHRFDADAYDRMQAAMLRASRILATHEHFDHLCGLTRSPHFDELAPKVLLTRAQRDSDAPMTVVDDGCAPRSLHSTWITPRASRQESS